MDDRKTMKIALAGNPNVGKSTVFNALTGMKQHTGNWTGKTVETAEGRCTVGGRNIILTDLPGTYSLFAHSAEEQVARDHICFSGSDGVIIVCDGSCLERNLNLVLQTLEITPHAVVCVNLLDEAAKKNISVDLGRLSECLGTAVCGASARAGKGLSELLEKTDRIKENTLSAPPVIYSGCVERALDILVPPLSVLLGGRVAPGFAALRILERSEDFIKTVDANTCGELKRSLDDEETDIGAAYRKALDILAESGMDTAAFRDQVAADIVMTAERIAGLCVTRKNSDLASRDRKIDRILTHRIWGLPVMLLILTFIFFITVKGANYPSMWLSSLFDTAGERLRGFLVSIDTADWLVSMIMDGIYCVVTWVVSVMLPPMAIFFPLFTLLEDVGYLPRAAFNLDRFFSRSGSCGKQALTMSMGLGCNAVGITGCRIIDSPRERLIAMLTNVFMPCNGRFPALIALSAMLFGASGFCSAFTLTAVISLGAVLTFIISAVLSKTLLKGECSSFALELPPYRRPQIMKVIVRSLFDRTVFVLGRAITAAAPAGLIIWLLENIRADGRSLISICSDALDPMGHIMGMDGAILMAFILGLPANEIVLPILIMIYTGAGTLCDAGSAAEMSLLFSENGWTASTVICTMIFMLSHFPCATSLMTVKKETGSWRWTILAAVIPTLAGILLCMAVSGISALIKL